MNQGKTMSFPKKQRLGYVIATTTGVVKVCELLSTETLRTLGGPDKEIWIYRVEEQR